MKSYVTLQYHPYKIWVTFASLRGKLAALHRERKIYDEEGCGNLIQL